MKKIIVWIGSVLIVSAIISALAVNHIIYSIQIESVRSMNNDYGYEIDLNIAGEINTYVWEK